MFLGRAERDCNSSPVVHFEDHSEPENPTKNPSAWHSPSSSECILESQNCKHHSAAFIGLENIVAPKDYML